MVDILNMKDKIPVEKLTPEISHIIEMAWCDETSFDAIAFQTGKSEEDVIKIMRTHMKPSSFRMWRKRVSGRKSKHQEL